MSALLRLTTYYLAFFFSKSILAISIGLTVFLCIAKIPFMAITFSKIIFLGLVFFLFKEEKLKQKLIFYKNFGVSKTLLLLLAIVFDTIISVIIYLIFLWIDS
ncbi:hypothetical protein HME9304_00477 [Flagellimonas maritima]|uniref:Uncharacterized protein n=1 Tax=Flagellimonas maritima TaxID=1383885 RepID=A0A2Z4LP13_9FLAO|nr:hypothetical protein HME9304_00477 [Allomuricauda aurantiaca]